MRRSRLSLMPRFAIPVLLALTLAPSTGRAVDCLVEDFAGTPSSWPDYGASDPVVLSSCAGTNNQTIDVVDRVVFLGDSLAVGTPPSTSNDFFRSVLADQLVTQYGLSAPSALWKSVNSLSGTTVVQDSGDFSSCAVWGARADDLLTGGMQLDACFPPTSLSDRTLVVIAVGANDFSVLAADAAAGATPAALQASIDAAMASLRAAVDWLLVPSRFPNGVFVVLANPLDFTDGSGDVSTCPGAAAAGFDDDFTPVLDLIAGANEEILDIVVDNDIDLVFARERFCGHGFASTDPSAPCYRGPGNANWFDSSCIHPTPTGHGELAADFLEVITTPAAASAVPALAPPALGALLVLMAGVVARRLRGPGDP